MPKPTTEAQPDTEVEPDPQLEKRKRKKYSTEDKLRILAEADQCKHGELGPLLRREKIYHNQLQSWRRQLAEGGTDGLSKTAPGPKPKLTAEQKLIQELELKNARLQRELDIANDCIAIQKKVSSLIERAKSEGKS